MGGVSASDLIIWSADVPDAYALMDALGAMPDLKWVKLDRAFMLRHLLTGRSDPNLIRNLVDMGYKVFLDDKDSEVPHKLTDIVDAWGPQRPTMLNCIVGGALSSRNMTPGQPDTDGLRRFADACHKWEIQPCGVPLLTSKTPETVNLEHASGLMDQMFFYLEQMLDAGFTDVICSPQEVKAIRREDRFITLALNTPGIQLAGAAQTDQARVGTPAAAVRDGADRLVIGRALSVGDKAANWARIVAELAAA